MIPAANLKKLRNAIASMPARPPVVNVVKQELDLMASVKGMYRILDLIGEQGSGGIGAIPASTMINDIHICKYS